MHSKAVSSSITCNYCHNEIDEEILHTTARFFTRCHNLEIPHLFHSKCLKQSIVEYFSKSPLAENLECPVCMLEFSQKTTGNGSQTSNKIEDLKLFKTAFGNLEPNGKQTSHQNEEDDSKQCFDSPRLIRLRNKMQSQMPEHVKNLMN